MNVDVTQPPPKEVAKTETKPIVKRPGSSAAKFQAMKAKLSTSARGLEEGFQNIGNTAPHINLQEEAGQLKRLSGELDTLTQRAAQQIGTSESSPDIPYTLKDELREAYGPEFLTYVHVTEPQLAEKIINEGLRTRIPKLHTTAMPLFDTSQSYDEQIENTLKYLQNWQQGRAKHSSAKAAVVVMLPNPTKVNPDELLQKSNAERKFNTVFEPLDKPDEKGNRYFISQQYLKGIIDITAGKFIKNPGFDPKPLQTAGLQSAS